MAHTRLMAEIRATYSQPSPVIMKPLSRWTVQNATTIKPISPAAATWVTSPTTSSAPTPISAEAARAAWTLPGRIPIDWNQRPVPAMRPPRNALL